MNYICTWFCADSIGEESIYPQTGELSSSKSHQDIYWKCLLVFFMTSKKFNRDEKHLFFTNIDYLPVIDNQNVSDLLDKLGVQIIKTDFKYKTPVDYYGHWKNQFYEFSILEFIVANYNFVENNFLILDSDCIFLKPVRTLFEKASLNAGFLSYTLDYPIKHLTNSLSREDLKVIYEDLLHKALYNFPEYHAGEFLLCSVENLKKIFSDFVTLWPQLLERHKLGLLKFNEEAHTLSYLYYKNDLEGGGANGFIKRIWTNPVFERNVASGDINLFIWHLPAEKIFGFPRLFNFLVHKVPNFGLDIGQQEYASIISRCIGIPFISIKQFCIFYFRSYYRASKKRIVKKLLSAQ